MGAGCCKNIPEFNPDGAPKDPQTKEQKKEDAIELRRAARAADWQQMRLLLRRMPLQQICSGAKRDEGLEEETGNTALHFSVSINHLRGVRKLLRYGLPPNIPNQAGRTPLHAALEGGKLKAARVLMERSEEARAKAAKPIPALVNQKDASGVSPLLSVVSSGRLRLTKEVLALAKDLGCEVEWGTRDKEGNSLLLYAAKWGWFEELEAWLGRAAATATLVLNTQNKQGETVLGHVLHFAASGLLPPVRCGPLVIRLLAAGALPNLPAFPERVPLLNLAAAANDMGVYEVLVRKGADPLTCKDALGRTPLHYAGAKGACTVAADLVGKGLKVYVRDTQGNTPLHLAAMRGQRKAVALLLERADDKKKALLTPNKSGLSAYHLALKAGPDDEAQDNSLSLIDTLGEDFTIPVIGRGKAVVDTPLLLAISGHQDRVVKALLGKGLSPNEANVRGELPLARVLSAATAATYENDATIFDALIGAGANMDAASETAHPLLAVCKNNLSKFAEKAVGVLTARCGVLNWDKRDEKGYTPLALAAYHDNAWLVRYLIDEVKVDPNDDSQRSASTAPEVVGTTGSLCCTKQIMMPGTVEGQTPLMCAAKGASVAATQLLLNRGARTDAVDATGRTALQHAMHMDRAASLQVAAALLQMGAAPGQGVRVNGPEEWKECIDLVGESWPHRAVRYGVAGFLPLWHCCGGKLELLATTADDADDMPGAEVGEEEKADFLDLPALRVARAVEEEDEELADDYNGEDSEKAADQDDTEGQKQQQPAAKPAGAVGEAAEHAGGSSDDDDCGEDHELAELIAAGQVESHYSGPSPRMMLRWRRRGAAWWEDFWVDADSLPDPEVEGEPDWADKYGLCEEGEEWLDEEDVEEEIWEAVRKEQRKAAEAARARQQQQAAAGAGDEGVVPPLTPSLVERVSSGLAHKLFRRRLPNAVFVAEEQGDVEGSGFAAGSPSKWLRRKSSIGSNQNAVSSSSCTTTAGPIAEALEAVEDVEDVEDGEAVQETEQQKDDPTQPLFMAAYIKSTAAACTRRVRNSVRARGSKLMSGVKGEKLWANEPYYQPATRFQGRPGYMDDGEYDLNDVRVGEEVTTLYHKYGARPERVYDGMVREWEARVAGYRIPEDKLLEGADLRARNIKWYHKSMSPNEYPLKIGKWKSFAKMSAKAVEEAKKRRPRKPNEKPKIRSKKAWFGLPDLPSRPELALTSPLVYAVRLGRVRCAAELCRLSGALPSMPDAHGHCPLAYAMFMLAKDRHSKPLQQLTDLLLAARPVVDSAMLWRMTLLPRLKKELAEAEASVAAKGGKENVSRRERKELMKKQETLEYLENVNKLPDKGYRSRDFPSVMEPLVAAALLNDVGRAAVLIRHCGANPNNAFVWLPDIPTYFNGMWEKQVGRCRSVVGPLHVAIAGKKYASVRAFLDLGCDPNLCGAEFSGNVSKDLARRAKLAQEKAQLGSETREAARDANPYAKLWADKALSIKAKLQGAKRFIASIEIPGFSRPHPWLSPLHLACRFGLADITYMLIKRGAAVNGGAAAACAPKSPLEEALSYARANAQAYGTTAERLNYTTVMERAYLEATPENQSEVDEATAQQKAKYDELLQLIVYKAQRLVEEGPKNKYGQPTKSPKDFLDKPLKALNAGMTLADWTPEGLAKLPVPGMGGMAMLKKGIEMVSGVLDYMDPIEASLRAVAIAAKILIKIYLEMIRRPIALYDPALACAHVMLWHRAPINVADKQTAILIRDILDNGNALEGADTSQSYYRWLGFKVDEKDTRDEAWVATAVQRISVLKSNFEYGYMKLNLATEAGEYLRLHKKFMGEVDQTIINTGTESLMPLYLQDMMMLEGVAGAGPTKEPSKSANDSGGNASSMVRDLIKYYIKTKAEKQKDLVDAYKEEEEKNKEAKNKEALKDWLNRFTLGEVPQQANRDEIARGLLPTWLYPTPGAAAKGGAPADEAAAAPANPPPQTEAEVIELIAQRFAAYSPETQVPKTFPAPPKVEEKNPFFQMLYKRVDAITWDWPEVTPEELEEAKPTVTDLSDVDVCRAVVRAVNFKRSESVAARSAELNKVAAGRAELMMKVLKAEMIRKAQMAKARIDETKLRLAEGVQFDEEAIFSSALEDPAWEAAAAKLGGGAVAAALLVRLRRGGQAGRLPLIADPLEFAKGLGRQAVEAQDPAALLAGIEKQLGAPLEPGIRNALKQDLQQAAASSPEEGPEAAAVGEERDACDIVDKLEEQALSAVQSQPVDPRVLADEAMRQVLDAVEDPDTYWDAASRMMPSFAAPLLSALREAVESGELPPPPDPPEELFRGLTEMATKQGSDYVYKVFEERIGTKLPPQVRDAAKAAYQRLSERVAEAYGEGGFGAVFEAVENAVADGLEATETLVMDYVDVAEEIQERGQQVVADVVARIEVVQEGGAEQIMQMLEGTKLPIPLPRQLGQLRSELRTVLEAASQATGQLSDFTKQLTGSVQALLGDADAVAGEGLDAATALGEQMAAALESVFETLQADLEEATDQLMAGLERMLEVDAVALQEAMGAAHEVLLKLLELLGINDSENGGGNND
ncbi:hypothetical protein Agub_g6877 [Astrephomene gubernaculifera]|uniref:Poly [ADP-ribose] polymerase n=1 Tax=Astrephomene gubernaculifera TaxID=47775 RepID=A0AAD3DP54_9CHLO|nr:hypothetical protein Agub_g6877 [Astrephomene gubernaculifera]